MKDYLQDAVNIFKKYSPIFRRHEWILSLYGSVLREDRHKMPNDVDLIATPRTEKPKPIHDVVANLEGYKMIHPVYVLHVHYGILDCCSIMLNDMETGLFVDINFREMHRVEKPKRRIETIYMDGEDL